eukprot:6685508-Pyramimonas_sp.AAC.1
MSSNRFLMTSHAAPLHPELSPDNRHYLASDSNDTNSLAILDRAAGRVQSSGIDRQTQLMILNWC